MSAVRTMMIERYRLLRQEIIKFRIRFVLYFNFLYCGHMSRRQKLSMSTEQKRTTAVLPHCPLVHDDIKTENVIIELSTGGAILSTLVQTSTWTRIATAVGQEVCWLSQRPNAYPVSVFLSLPLFHYFYSSSSLSIFPCSISSLSLLFHVHERTCVFCWLA